MAMPGRSFSAGSQYRYGFNGKENDRDISNGAIDFGARIYDSRLGRWLAVDPMRKASPGETPYRFGHNNPLEFRDPDGNWEEDGHFWTVYAMGVALGLKKSQARELAVKAEWYDHIVHADNSMSMQPIPGKEWMASKILGGLALGTWADPEWQKTMHGLTGGSQSILLSSVIANIIAGDLYKLHTLGDASAHSYIDENKQRVMYGQHGRNEPLYHGIARLFLGDITFEHAKGGPASGLIADNIADRPEEYRQYTQNLLEVINQLFYKNLKSSASTYIFDYVQRNGKSKEANIFLLSSFVDLESGVKSFSSTNKSNMEKFEGYLNDMGIKYTQSSKTTRLGGGQGSYASSTIYSIKIKH